MGSAQISSARTTVCCSCSKALKAYIPADGTWYPMPNSYPVVSINSTMSCHEGTTNTSLSAFPCGKLQHSECLLAHANRGAAAAVKRFPQIQQQLTNTVSRCFVIVITSPLGRLGCRILTRHLLMVKTSLLQRCSAAPTGTLTR